MKKISLFLWFLGAFGISQAQIQKNIDLSFFSPYFLQPGISVGLQLAPPPIYEIKIQPFAKAQLAYYGFSGVQNNLLLQANYGIKFKNEKALKPKIFLGLAYQVSRQRLSTDVNLGTGEFEHTYNTIGYLLPSLNAGFDFERENKSTYFINLFAGRKYGLTALNAAYFGLEIGLSLSNSKSK
ncbi:MAG: hypothetical protein JXQ87_15615 [Bacteroidia bacterium]